MVQSVHYKMFKQLRAEVQPYSTHPKSCVHPEEVFTRSLIIPILKTQGLRLGRSGKFPKVTNE